MSTTAFQFEYKQYRYPNHIHGMHRTPTYRTWERMIQRCSNPNHKAYKNYGGRGITVCPRWVVSFAAFLEDMGVKPKGLTLERIDNDSGYNHENCKWATMFEQHHNTRRNRWVKFNGNKMILQDFVRAVGKGASTILYRLDIIGETPDEIYDHFKGVN